MASFEFKLPDIGEGVTEGEVVAWHVHEGESVAEDQVMVEVMTDKATVTIGAPRAGKIVSLRADVGATIQVGEVLVVLETGNGSRATGGKPSKMPASAVGDIQESLPGASYFAQRRASERPDAAVPRTPPRSGATGGARSGVTGGARTAAMGAGAMQQGVSLAAGATAAPAPARGPERSRDKPLATPATRKLARDLGVDLRLVPASGAAGRVTKEDLLRFTESDPGPAGLDGPDGSVGSDPTPVGAGLPRGTAHGDVQDERIPFVGMRRKIAERMSLSKRTAAHFTFVEECDAGELIRLRDRLKERAALQGVQLTYLPIIVKAVIAALRRHPRLNSSLDAERNELVIHGSHHIGIAAATAQGLVVPVVHHAERLSLLELAAEIDRLGTAAREGRLTVADLSGSTFTVTSLGKQAGLFAIPIINQPNVGIMGIHRIKERPVVRAGEIVVGHEMLLSLSLDHRIIDGHEGAAFAYDVIGYLEDPASMLLDL